MVRLVALSLVLVAPSALAKKPKKQKGPPPDALAVDVAPPAPTGPPMIDVPCPYQAGTAHQFQVTRITERTTPNQPATSRTTSTVLDLQVVSATPEGAVIELKYGVSQLQGDIEPIAAEVAERLAAKWAMTPIRLALTHESKEVRVENLDEVLGLFSQVLDEVEAALRAKEPPVPDEHFQAVRGAFEQPQMAEQLVRRDIEPLLAFTCGAFPLDPTEYEVSLPNPMGGPAFPAKGKITTTRYDYSTLAIDVTETLDPIRADKLLKPLLERADLPQTAEADAMLAQLSLDVSSTNHVEVSLKDGWPIRLEQVRRAGAMGGGRVDTLRVTKTR